MPPAYHTYDDHYLLQLLQQGDERALRELYERYWQSLLNRSLNFLRDEQAAQDAVQEVFISLWQHQNKSSIHNVNHYLHQAVRFRSLNIIRDKKNDLAFDERLLQLTDEIFAGTSLEAKELAALIQQQLDALPPDQQTIFSLHREHQYTYREIAEELNISVKTVEKKMSRSLRSLRTAMNKFISILPIIFAQL